MSLTITDEQWTTIDYYLRCLRDGDVDHIIQSRRHHDTLVKFMATLAGRPIPSRENDEEIIRRNLQLWGSLHP